MKNWKWTSILIAILIFGFFMVGCGSSSTTESTTPTENANSNASSTVNEAGSRSDWPNRIVIGASSPGGSYYIFGGVLGTLINEQLQVDASVQDTGGGVANVQLAHAGEFTVGLASNIEAVDFYYNQGMDGFSGIAPVSNLAFQLVVATDSDIQGWSDLNGKVISMSSANSSHDMSGRAILDALGIEPKQIVNAGNDDINSMFRDGRVDAMFLGTAHPAPAFAEIDSTNPLRLIPFTEEEMNIVQDTNAFFGRMTVPGGTYNGSPDDVTTLSYWNMFIAPKSIPDDLAYELAKLVIENEPTFKDGHKSASIQPEFVAEIKVPLHPGAYKYYQELGIEIPDEIKPQ